MSDSNLSADPELVIDLPLNQSIPDDLSLGSEVDLDVLTSNKKDQPSK